MIRLAAIIMVKNEEKRIRVTLNSVIGICDGIIVYDTGSTDKTCEIVATYLKELKFPNVKIITGTFENFSASRNLLLREADKLDYTHYMLLDCNEEIIDGTHVKNFIEQNLEYDGFLAKQRWFTGQDTEYFNIKIIKARSNCIYKYPVHEHIHIPSNKITTCPEIVFYQNRIEDTDGKTQHRWAQDAIVLKDYLHKNKNDPRAQYYLAQTYDCLNNTKQSIKWYLKRANNCDGFYEERFHSLLNLGKRLSDISYLFKSLDIIERAEPLVEIAKYYRLRSNFKFAFVFAKLACELKIPENEYLLWVDTKCYQHDRWHELSISSFYVNETIIGKDACIKAIESGYLHDLNRHNLSFYQKD